MYIDKKIQIKYFCYVDKDLFPGVVNKATQIVDSMNEMGYEAEVIFPTNLRFSGSFSFLKKMLFERSARVYIVRAGTGRALLYTFPLLVQRMRGSKIIFDIPTPLRVAVKEVIGNKSVGLVFKARGLVSLYLTYPWVCFLAHRVIQYSNESTYFSFGIKNKSILLGNGISIKKIKQKKIKDKRDGELTFIGVGSLADWHGYDRLIKAIANYLNKRKCDNPKRLSFIIVGEGDVVSHWKELANNCGVSHCVHFVGKKLGPELDGFFDDSDIAIGSLGLYRKGLSVASELKVREYAARGLPYIMVADDPDIKELPAFIKKFPNNDDDINLEEIIEWHGSLDNVAPEDIRGWANKIYDYKNKINLILDGMVF